jgi:predicted patatin/cPLA2 family phospholipase
LHPVVKQLLARKNQNVPVNDGKRITLVLFGGIMVGVRGAGALVALEELGLTNAFNEIYAMSSGFGNASYFLAGQMPLGATIYYDDMAGRRFLNLLRFWKIADIDYLMKTMKNTKPLKVKDILSRNTKLYTMMHNASLAGKFEYLEVHNFKEDEYFDILKASSSLKYVAGGKVKIGNNYYQDIFTDGALAKFFNKILSTDATDILVLYNYPWQQRYIQSKFKDIDQNRVCEICLSENSGSLEYLEKLTRFQTKSSKLKQECQKAGDKVKHIFGSSEAIKLL